MSTETVTTEVGSYFISNYPPFSRWSPESLPDVWQALREPPADVPLGLYVHIPFCRKRCKFCYFKVFTDKNATQIEDYVRALSREIELISRAAAVGGRPFRFVYFGGGTPSFLSVRQLSSLVERLRAHVHWDEAEEVTFECEPGTLQEAKVRALRDLGVTRLSLGVENFNDQVLEDNGRAHLSREVYRAWEWITAAGFHNVNIDLIAGMVGETWENWQDNIRRARELAPDSLTVYQMELPFNTVYSRDLLGRQAASPVADWPTKRGWVAAAFEQLAEDGYQISSAYTLVRDPSRVRFLYRDHLWEGSDLLSTGIASFGHLSGVHYQNKAEWPEYLGELNERGRLPLARGLRLTPRQRLIRELILQLKRGFLRRGYFRDKFQTEIVAQWAEVWQTLVDEGLAQIDPDEVRLTLPGLLRVDSLLPAFFEPEHRGVRYT